MTRVQMMAFGQKAACVEKKAESQGEDEELEAINNSCYSLQGYWRQTLMHTQVREAGCMLPSQTLRCLEQNRIALPPGLTAMPGLTGTQTHWLQ